MLHNNKNRPSPQTEPKVQAHVRAHEAVIGNELWYGDQAPDLGEGFSAAGTDARATTVIEILLRAAKRAGKNGNPDQAEAYYHLADKLEACGQHRRCGSLACPRCARAFQKAKMAAQQTAITNATKTRPDKQLVLVTLIPRTKMYGPGTLNEIDKANRWLKDTMKPLGSRMMLGSADLGWETRRGERYIQVHWHLAMWTGSPDNLQEKLKLRFRKTQKYERPVDVREAMDLGFLGYMNKAIKLSHLLRTNRTHLPELLVVLDRTEPLDLMVYTKVRLSAQNGRLAFKPIGRVEGTPADRKSGAGHKPCDAIPKVNVLQSPHSLYDARHHHLGAF